MNKVDIALIFFENGFGSKSKVRTVLDKLYQCAYLTNQNKITKSIFRASVNLRLAKDKISALEAILVTDSIDQYSELINARKNFEI